MRDGWIAPVAATGGFALGGRWDKKFATALDRRLNQMLAAPAVDRPSGPIEIDCRQVERLDTVGACLLVRFRATLRERGGAELVGVRAEWRALIEAADDAKIDLDAARGERAPVALAGLNSIGKATAGLGGEIAALLGFFGLVVVRLGGVVLRPARLNVTSLVHHMEDAGLNALPIVALLAFVIGFVISYQSAFQLGVFGAEILTVDLIGLSVLREIGALITAVVVAGRSGSAMTAQIGTMQVNEEIDAMRAIGIDPTDALVLPRILALMLVVPMLTFFANIMGLLGGALVVYLVVGLDLAAFFRQLIIIAVPLDFIEGMVKAPVFAFAIGMVGCFQGMSVSGSAASVGRRTTVAVVESIFLVIVIDGAFSIFFTQLRF